MFDFEKAMTPPDYQWENTLSAPWQDASIYNLDFIELHELLYTVLRKLILQKKRSRSLAGMCLYKVFEETCTLSCAAGLLFPDNYNFYQGQGGVWGTIVDIYKLSTNFRREITDLQGLHDSEYNWTSNGFSPTKFRLNRIKRSFNTETSHLIIDKLFPDGGRGSINLED